MSSWIPAIDCSQYQGAIDWTKISEPIAMLKISGGDAGLYYDKEANHNYYGAKSAGKAVGGYHFAGGTDPIKEADFFLRGMMPFVENDVMALDWEVQNPDPVGWCNQFVTHVHDKCGVWPLLYINLSTLNAHDWTPVLTNCGLWLADWNNNPDGPAVTNHTYVMQQYNDGPFCDHDAWFGTIDQFKKYGWHAPVAQTTSVASPEPPQPPVTPTVTSTTGSTTITVTVPSTEGTAVPVTVPVTSTSTTSPTTTTSTITSTSTVTPNSITPTPKDGPMKAMLTFLRTHTPYIIGLILVAVNALIDQGSLHLAPHLVDLVNAALMAAGLGVLHKRQSNQ